MIKTDNKIVSMVLVIFTLCFTACSQTKLLAKKNQTQSAPKNINSQSTFSPNNPPNRTGKEIWSGESAGFRIRWTTDDLTATSIAGTENTFSVRDFARIGFDEYARSMNERENIKAKILFYNRHFKLLSVVGSLLSFEDERDSSSELSNLPSDKFPSQTVEVGSRFLTIDLAKPGNLTYTVENDEPTTEVDPTHPGKAVLLTDLFSEQDILRALLSDAIIKKALSKVKKTAPPTNLTELVSQLEEQDLIAPNCVFYLTDDYLTRFAFHHLENNKVAVRLSLQPTIQSCRGEKAQLGLLLPISVSLKESLALADLNKQGFLMKQQAVKFTPKQESYVGFDEESINNANQ